MLLVTNRPAVYVVIDGVTVELEVDKPTEVSDYQGKKLIKRQICMAVIDAPKPITKKASKKVNLDIESPASKKSKQLK